MEAFEANMADAELLLRLAQSLLNTRVRRARRELRERLGTALHIPARQHADIDCVESEDLFIVLKPAGQLDRSSFSDPRPLLRQALVAGCSATETFVNDLVMDHITYLTHLGSSIDGRLDEIPMTVADWRTIEALYKRMQWGLHEIVIKDYVAQYASTSPTKIGGLMSVLGVKDWSKKVDSYRRAPKGSTVEFLERVTDRRNQIAHTGDRSGQGRASIAAADVEQYLVGMRSVVVALNKIVPSHCGVSPEAGVDLDG